MIKIVVIISADAEWKTVRDIFPDVPPRPSPFGEWFVVDMTINRCAEPVLFFQGGWGKISAAASAQYAIDRWKPALLINLGTCGGFAGEIARGTIILAERTVVYDIVEQMADPDAAIAHYSTAIDLSWLEYGYPHEVRRTLLVSADRDLVAAEIARLKADFGAVAGDWESGAIAWVAARNETKCLILRGVSDLVSSAGGEAYADFAVFVSGTREIMTRLVDALPAWIARFPVVVEK